MSESRMGGRQPLPSPEKIATLPEDGGEKYNRLIFESSPYLLQHAANPVDWYAWNNAAFERAAREDKPIFLSIGYATCHWCHVMEHESFEDAEVAQLLNSHFVCIKVDKEERPDIDEIYMAACLAMNGQGGWPLTALLTPDRQPFFTGTYFPKTSRYGRIGMIDLVPRIAEYWSNKRNDLLENAERIQAYLVESNRANRDGVLNNALLEKACRTLASQFDERHGGFGDAPKFPTPHYFNFLLRYAARHDFEPAKKMTVDSLRMMRRGGVYDHVGFGFHRYSTDRRWLLPHFEKMLYDQALLAFAYLEAFEATRRPGFAQTAREIFSYVLRDMTAPEGGFYSAEDADSEGEEGKFYVWRPDWVRDVLGAEEAALFCRVFQISEDGNFREESTGKATGDSIAHRQMSWDDLAASENMTVEALQERIEAARRLLFKARETRVHPFKDDKVLTDWNGLMIGALAYGGRVLDAPEYTHAASRAMAFLLETCRSEDGRLLKRFRSGKAGLAAHLDDYAFVIWGLIELYQTAFRTEDLEQAVALTAMVERHFADSASGAYFFTADDSENLIVRGLRLYDGAIPSGNAAMAYNLIRLAHLTGNVDYKQRAEAVAQAFAGQVSQQPTTACHLLSALDLLLNGTREVVLVGKLDSEDMQALLAEVRAAYRPDTLVVVKDPDDARFVELAPFTELYEMIDGQAAAYVCREFTCLQPTADPQKLREALN